MPQNVLSNSETQYLIPAYCCLLQLISPIWTSAALLWELLHIWKQAINPCTQVDVCQGCGTAVHVAVLHVCSCILGLNGAVCLSFRVSSCQGISEGSRSQPAPSDSSAHTCWAGKLCTQCLHFFPLILEIIFISGCVCHKMAVGTKVLCEKLGLGKLPAQQPSHSSRAGSVLGAILVGISRFCPFLLSCRYRTACCCRAHRPPCRKVEWVLLAAACSEQELVVAVARWPHYVDGSVEVSRERPHGREESDSSEPAALGLSRTAAEAAPVTGVSSHYCAAEVRNYSTCLI